MIIRRIDPNIVSSYPDKCRDFYAGFFGLRVKVEMGWIVTFVSPDNPTLEGFNLFLTQNVRFPRISAPAAYNFTV